MNVGLLSIDDFYEDPYAIRNIALTTQYFNPGYSMSHVNATAPWPGKMSSEAYSTSDVDLKVSKLLHKNLRQMRQYDSGRFRISKAGDVSQNLLHVDNFDDTSYAGVLYLSLPEHCKNIKGTIFYTHKATGKDSANNKEEVKNIILSNGYNDLSQWDINLISYMAFNRLIVYPANKFHGIGELFGDCDSNARLIQVFFWNEIK